MVTTRTLEEHRAARAARRHPAGRRRRRRTTAGFPRSAAVVARVRAVRNLGIYLGVSGIVALLIAYLALSAQVTAASYELARLQNQQAQLQADQAQLRLGEASQRTPAQVEHDAQQAGLQRTVPAGYDGYQPSVIEVAAPVGEGPADTSPAWQRALASVLTSVSGTRDVMASDR